jgi:3-oxoacyl-[acyl-carrier protein] reductase
MAANLDAIFLSTRAALGLMGPGGKVVLVSSTAGQRGEAGHADYAATKGAIIALTKSLAIEYAPDILVNCVAPGWVDTEMSASAFGGGGKERIARTIPLRRIPSAEEIAGPILFLCSDLASHVTGEVVNVNGGSVLCG